MLAGAVAAVLAIVATTVVLSSRKRAPEVGAAVTEEALLVLDGDPLDAGAVPLHPDC